MNERIKELAGKALDQSVPQTWTTLTAYDLAKFTEKFSELLIRECAKFAYHYVDGNETLSHYREKDWKELPGDIEFCMKVHFGVEE